MKRSLAVLAILTAAVVVLYRKGVRLYWTYDDPWFLHVALMRRWTEGFIGYRSPEAWTTYSPPLALDFARQTRTTWHR